jgi:hypothetical protein
MNYEFGKASPLHPSDFLISSLQLVSQPAYRRQQLRIGRIHFDAGTLQVAFLVFIKTAVTYLKALIR